MDNGRCSNHVSIKDDTCLTASLIGKELTRIDNTVKIQFEQKIEDFGTGFITMFALCNN